MKPIRERVVVAPDQSGRCKHHPDRAVRSRGVCGSCYTSFRRKINEDDSYTDEYLVLIGAWDPFDTIGDLLESLASAAERRGIKRPKKVAA